MRSPEIDRRRRAVLHCCIILSSLQRASSLQLLSAPSVHFQDQKSHSLSLLSGPTCCALCQTHSLTGSGTGNTVYYTASKWDAYSVNSDSHTSCTSTTILHDSSCTPTDYIRPNSAYPTMTREITSLLTSSEPHITAPAKVTIGHMYVFLFSCLRFLVFGRIVATWSSGSDR